MLSYKLYQGDCLTEMRNISDKSIDMILCDLPYGVTHNKSDVVIPFEPLWEQYNRVIKDNGAIVLFAQGVFYVDLVNSNRKMFRYDLVWDKQLATGFLNANRMPLRRHEQVAVFYKKLPTYNPQFSIGEPSHSKGTLYMSKRGKNSNYGEYRQVADREDSTQKYPTSILSFQKPHPSVAKHRTEKSIELLRYLIRTYTNENETVLDNCMGAGSTVISAILENRNAIGVEIDKTYFDVAKKRIEEMYESVNEKSIFVE